MNWPSARKKIRSNITFSIWIVIRGQYYQPFPRSKPGRRGGSSLLAWIDVSPGGGS